VDAIKKLSQVYLINELLLSNLLLEKLLSRRQSSSFWEATMLATKKTVLQEEMQKTIPHVQDNPPFRTGYSQRPSSLYGPRLFYIHPEVP